MPACTMIREASGDCATYVLSGRFEGISAWELAARLTEERLPRAVLDFSRCHEFHDYAIAVLAQALLGLVGLRVNLRGLRQHQERVFKCFGVDAAELSHPVEVPRPQPEPELAREVV
jgi:hypothetical protein